jgi:hypothetical protein
MRFEVKFDDVKLEKLVADAAADTLEEIAPELKAESERLCPKKRGYNGGLVSTASVEVDKENLSLVMSYKAPHAHLVHEKTTWHHAPGTQAKFLEQPINQNAGNYLRRIADAIRSRIGR